MAKRNDCLIPASVTALLEGVIRLVFALFSVKGSLATGTAAWSHSC